MEQSDKNGRSFFVGKEETMTLFQRNSLFDIYGPMFVGEDKWDRAKNFTVEGKKGLTMFMENDNRIPSRDKVKNCYDRIIPDDWEKLRIIADQLVKKADKDEMERLTTPIVPRMFYKSSTDGGKPRRVVVEAIEESRKFKMYVFDFTDGYHLATELYFSLGEGTNLKIDDIVPWYKRLCDLYGLFGELGDEDEAFMHYTSHTHDYYDTLFEVAQNMLYSEELTKVAQDDAAQLVADCMDLIVYMNHCIDIEIEKRKQAEEDYLKNNNDDDNTVNDSEKKKRKVVYHENSKKNAREIHIGDICINLGKHSGTKKSGVMHRKCLCWGVRGHKRYYKSGKVVYIKPYKKGRDRMKIDPDGKTYKLKGEKVY